MPGKNDQVTERDADLFTISRTFDVSRDTMFDLWTSPHHLLHWWGPKGFAVKSATVDLRPGGKFHYCLAAPDGSDMWGRFVYRTIDKPRLLEFISSFSDPEGGVTIHPMAPAWPREMFSRITFEEHHGQTTVTVEWRPFNATEIERKTFLDGKTSMKQGWTGTLDMLEAYVKKIASA
ncbi:MAG: SRPBCC domain-containing protein [candidate division Zixibacteria bacterium]|jgi:uncharacterized protein YndB with AHSA1/START domain|nr:SRPBCC domain-containing protein [candidate division Zixibacteria bacterium]